MKGLSAAVGRIQQAIRQGEKILIHGDYDADGITATAILGRTLNLLKADFATFLPERTRDGYGVSESAIRDARKLGTSLLITVDCGIAAHHEIQVACGLGMDVIVIDHHKIPAEGLPGTSMILNPQQTDCDYPFQGLTAAGLVFKLSQGLIENRVFRFLDLVALSVVSDVAPLVGENRILVKQGLKSIGETPNLGLQALAAVSGIRGKTMNVGHLGFILGPRINACGRMSTPDIALRLLMTENRKEAESLAHVLDEENKMRQREERQTLREAIWDVEHTVNFNRERILVVARDGWHQGVVGIVASRLAEKYHRPAIVIALEGDSGKGSGRSIRKFDLFRALQASGDVLEEFGGHELAAGLVVKKENLAEFRERINRYAQQEYSSDVFVKEVPVDLELSLSDFHSDFIQELKRLEPHGVGNPRPVFLTRGLEIKAKKTPAHAHSLQFWVTDGILTYEAVWQNRTGDGMPDLATGKTVDLFYTVKTRVWDGMESLVLEVKDIVQ